MDNQESSIIVGENIPIITGQSTSASSGTTNPFTTIKREDVGVKLKVTPSIGEGDVVRLKIRQEISAVINTPTVGSVSRTTKREIKTVVLAANGETIILGGLIKDNITRSDSKVPLLGDIPWLGELFKSSSKKISKQNLLVFLRPTILRNKKQAKEMSQKKFDELWKLNLNIKKAKGLVHDKKLKTEKAPKIEELYHSNRLIR
jgi:general secretion pathway protein D